MKLTIQIMVISLAAFYSCRKPADLSCSVSEPIFEKPIMVDLNYTDYDIHDGSYKVYIPDSSNRVYLWNTGDTTSYTIVTQVGIYEVNVYDTSGNYLYKMGVELTEGAYAYIPTVFTPNGDGLNDEWKPTYVHACTVREVVYSENGKKVYESESLTKTWDGTDFKGRDLPKGKYNYFVSVLTKNGKREDYEGYVLIKEY